MGGIWQVIITFKGADIFTGSYTSQKILLYVMACLNYGYKIHPTCHFFWFEWSSISIRDRRLAKKSPAARGPDAHGPIGVGDAVAIDFADGREGEVARHGGADSHGEAIGANEQLQFLPAACGERNEGPPVGQWQGSKPVP